MRSTLIGFKELKAMIDSGDVAICRLPPEKRGLYTTWEEFERRKDAERDFWNV